jgi:hypothetical protein
MDIDEEKRAGSLPPGEEKKMPIPWRMAIFWTFFCALVLPAQQHASRADADPGWSELISSMEKMHRAMSSVAPSGASDVDFVQLMLPHHRAAIDMAKSELLFGKSPEMRRLAQEIIANQQSEIDLMQLWLKKHAEERLKGRQASDPSSKGD